MRAETKSQHGWRNFLQSALTSGSRRETALPRRLLVVPMAWERWSLWGGVCAGRRCRVGDVTGWQWGDWFVVSPGIGLVRSRDLAVRLKLSVFKEIWLVGICGGLDSQLAAGDLLNATQQEAFSSQGHVSSTQLRESSWQELPLSNKEKLAAVPAHHRVYLGAAICAEQILSRAGKLELAQTGRGAIVEMESMVWLEWARERQIPFVHLRIVSDVLESEPLLWSHLWRGLSWQNAPAIATDVEHAQRLRGRARWVRLLPSGVQDSLKAAIALRQLGKCLRLAEAN